MKKYELMTIYPLADEESKKGAEALKATLTKFGAEIQEEKPFGDRDLTYEIAKQKRGRFVLFTVSANPAKISEIEGQFKLTKDVLKYLFVKLEEDKKN